MLKITLTVAVIAVILILPLRIAVSTGGFLSEGIVEGLQACKQNSDCIWVAKGCCACYDGGREMLINKNKKFMYNLLVKEICMGEEYCSGDNYCQEEEVFCDRTCKFGKKTYSKPLLVQ